MKLIIHATIVFALLVLNEYSKAPDTCSMLIEIKNNVELKNKKFNFDNNKEINLFTVEGLTDLYPSIDTSNLKYLSTSKKCYTDLNQEKDSIFKKGYSLSKPIQLSDSLTVILGDLYSITRGHKRANAEFVFEFRLDNTNNWVFSKRQPISLY